MLPNEPFWTIKGDDWEVDYYFKKHLALERFNENKEAGKKTRMKRVEVWKVFSEEVKGD